MTPKPQRRISLQLRFVLAIVLVAFAYFVGQYRKAVPRGRAGDSGAVNSSTAARTTFPADSASDRASRFAWIPAFPGAEIEGITSKLTRGQIAYGFHFRTAQDFKSALAFYGDKLKEAGFQVEIKDSSDKGGELHADSADGKRTFDVVAAKVYSGTGAEIGVTAVLR
jgi:hypothetical protein